MGRRQNLTGFYDGYFTDYAFAILTVVAGMSFEFAI
jgi:hypothetical protein